MVTATIPSALLDTIMERSQRRELTVDDWQVLPDDGNRYEIIGGQLIVSPSPRAKHQRVSFKLTGALNAYLGQSGVGEGFSAPFDVYLSSRDVV